MKLFVPRSVDELADYEKEARSTTEVSGYLEATIRPQHGRRDASEGQETSGGGSSCKGPDD